MDRTVAVTGGSGKLGRAVVAALIQEGWTVVNFDRVPSPDGRARFIRRPHRLRPGRRGVLRHRRGPPRRRRRRPSGRHPGRDLRPHCRHLRQQPGLHLSRFPGRQAVQHSQPCLGVQRDAARLPVPQPARVRSAGRKRPAHPRSRLRPCQGSRGGDGAPVLPVESESKDDRAALLQRHGPSTPTSPPSRATPPLANGICGLTSTPRTEPRRSFARSSTTSLGSTTSSSPTSTPS
jgi:hypothetical protein